MSNLVNLSRSKTIGLAMLLVAVSPTLSVHAQSMSDADRRTLQQSLADYDAGRLSQALGPLQVLAKRYGNDAEIQAATGMTLAELGNIQGAVPLLHRAHTLSPRRTDFTTNLAVAYMKAGQASAAELLLGGAVREGTRDVQLHVLLAQAHMQADHPAPAAEAFQQAATLLRAAGSRPDEILLHDWAVALLQSGHAPEAANLLREAPETAGAASLQALLAEAEEGGKRYESAALHFKRAAELDPSEANIYAYGNELMQHWTFPAAAQILRFGVERYPSSERMRMALGIAYYGNNQYVEAIPVLSKLLDERPDSAQGADLLGRSCAMRVGGDVSACTHLRSFAEAHPNNARASLYAAVVILRQPADQQDTKAAETLLLAAVHADPQLAEAWYQLGVVQQTNGKWQNSVQPLERAIALQPAYPEAHYRLARAYSRLNRRDEAKQQVELQQKYTAEAKDLENKRMQEVMTFLTSLN